MKIKNFTRKTIQKFIAAGLVFSVLSISLTSFIVMQTKLEKERRSVETTRGYAVFEDHVQTFLINKANMMRGFLAYIKTFENYKDEEVYEYLGHLIGKDNKYIRNIGIIKDTTIIWNYPKEENEKAIGTDLSNIARQFNNITRTKSTMDYSFDGPVDLIQGGKGYTIRVPIEKDGDYWGMISIVLRVEAVQELFDTYAKDCGIKVAIIDKSNYDTLVYGDENIVNQASSVFDSAFTGAKWNVYVDSNENKDNSTGLIMIITSIGIFFIMVATYVAYRSFKNSEEIEYKNSSLSKAVMRDSLTGIYNRKYFDIRIVEETEKVNRYGGEISIIFFDLDRFKKVNDTYGHAFGDNVLKEVVSTVKKSLRKGDIFARWGGEEFVVLMPETALDGAIATAEKLRSILENLDHPTVGKVTVSFGAAQYVKDEFIGCFFKRVDEALYLSKKNGRNQVTKSESTSNILRRIHWKNSWICGNEKIDEEHKQLLDYGNDLIDNSFSHSSKEKSIEFVNMFASHISMHFRNEEEVLRSNGYKKLEDHIKAHKLLEEKAKVMTDKLYKNLIGPQELFLFLQNEVIIGHLLEEDVKFFYLFS